MIVLHGNPYSTNNMYYHSGSRAFIKSGPAKMKNDWIKEARSQWKSKPSTEDMVVYIHLYFGDRRKRDWDNYHKLSMDALTGIVWKDDSQIQEAHIFKHYDKADPRIEVIVENESILKQRISENYPSLGKLLKFDTRR